MPQEPAPVHLSAPLTRTAETHRYRMLLGFLPLRPNVSSRTTAAHHPPPSLSGGRGLYIGSYLSPSFFRAMVALRVMSHFSPTPEPTSSSYSSCPRTGSSLLPSSSVADAVEFSLPFSPRSRAHLYRRCTCSLALRHSP